MFKKLKEKKKSESKTKDPFSGDNFPNSFLLLAIGLFGTLIISFVLILVIGFFNYLFTSFFLTNTLIVIKYCIGLIFWVILSSLPVIGIAFIITLPFQSIEILNLLSIQAEINIWISFILFFLVAIGGFLFNTLSQIYLIREEYSDVQFKENNQRYTLIIYVSSIIIGIILIFTSNIIFSNFFTFISAL